MTKKTIEYVLIHARNEQGKILLVLKDRPVSQKGKLNLVGGKIEPGETPNQAAIRELHEETGLYSVDIIPSLCGQIIGPDFHIYCYSADVQGDEKLSPREGETEKVDWYNYDVLSDERLMNNLRVVIPLLQMGVVGWTVNHFYEMSSKGIVVTF